MCIRDRRYSWPQALLAMGLLQAYEHTKDKTALSSVFSYLRRWKNSGYPISHVDHVMNGSVALWTEEILTREKREDAESLEALWICREGADICAGWIKAAKKTADGILAYRSQHPDWLFADTLGMLCPFACRYGVQKQDKDCLLYTSYSSHTAVFLGRLCPEKGVDELLDCVEAVWKKHPDFHLVLGGFWERCV